MMVAKALEGEKKLRTTMPDAEKAKAFELAYSTLILYLSDKVLCEVSKEKITVGVRVKLL